MVRPALVALALLATLTLISGGCRRRAAAPPAAPPTSAADAAAPATPDGPVVRLYPTPAAALREVLRRRPRVIGFGEVHQKTSSAKVTSAVRRFTEQLLDALAPHASDLIVETWVAAGRCGAEERRVVKNVEAVTERPASTEDEVLSLLRRAKARGVRPHILTVSCADYRLLLGAAGVDYEKLLGLITRHLQRKAQDVLAARARAAHDAGARAAAPVRGIVALYGGALHNDLYPSEGLEAFSYAAALQQHVGEGAYVEVDLYVPEFIADDATLARESWFPLFRRHAASGQVVLIERGVSSYVLIFPRTAAAPAPRPAPLVVPTAPRP